MKKLFYTFIIGFGIVSLLYAGGSRHYIHDDNFINQDLDALWYQLNIVAKRSKIHWRNPTTWDIVDGDTTIGITPSFSTFTITGVTSPNATFAYLEIAFKHTETQQDFNLFEYGQAINTSMAIVRVQIVNRLLRGFVWIKLDSSQRFLATVNADGETAYMKCRAYREE